jgi:hypothetical protein
MQEPLKEIIFEVSDFDFPAAERPKVIRLHFVRDEVFAG